jgi:hypothetical protein
MAANQRPAAVGYALGLFDTNTLEDRIMNLLARANRFRKTWARLSALGVSGLLFTTCLGVSGFSIQVTQPHNADANLQPFVGTWQARFKGKVFETIKLEKQQGKLTGSVRGADIEVDKDGELTSAHAIDSSDPDPIVEATLASGVLRITIKEKDSEDTIQFEMKLTGPDQAELRILAPPDVPTPKPWRLERVKDGQ